MEEYNDVISMVNKHSYELRQNAQERSIRQSRVKYETRKKTKHAGFKRKLAAIVLAATLTVGLTVQAKNHLNELDAQIAIETTLAKGVKDATYTTGQMDEYEHPMWYINYEQAARNTLTENKDFDIDTRIYGCYNGLSEYQKDESMNQIYQKMNALVEQTPEEFTQEEINACSYDSFQSYISSKNISLEDYEKLMEEIIDKYATYDRNASEIQKLLDTLNGGSGRNGRN